MASLYYNNFWEALAKGDIDFDTHTFKAMLVTTSYTPDQDSHAFRSDITGEASGTGYTAGGQTLDSITITQNNTSNRADIDFADETFSTVTVTNVKGYVVYKSTGVAATDILVCYIEFTEGAQSTSAGNFTIIPPAGGAFSLGN